jgi:SAM-dependent methyltransferase
LINLSIVSHYLFRLILVLSRRIPYFQNLFKLLPIFTSRPTQTSMDLFGKALEDYDSNDMKSKFLFYKNCLSKEYNEIINYDLGIYFRSLETLNPLEKKLIDSSYGNILDVGSSTGYYIPYLMAKGTTIGIEISSRINNIARKNGLHNCITGDIFKYKFNTKFDTITLIGNDIALSGTKSKVKKMLKKFRELLNEKGQVLLIIRHIRTLKYWHVVFTPEYNNRVGIPAKYLFMNINYFRKLALKSSFHSSILGKYKLTGNPFYLIRLVKTS